MLVTNNWIYKIAFYSIEEKNKNKEKKRKRKERTIIPGTKKLLEEKKQKKQSVLHIKEKCNKNI